MEPVEIDIRMKQNVSEEGKKATKAVGDLDDAAAKAGDVLKEKISGQRQLIKELEADIAKIQKAYERATPGRAKMEMGQELGAAKRALEEESDALTLLEGQVEKTAEKHTMLRTEVMNAKDELARLEMAGKRGSAEWDTAAAKLGHLNDQMKDTNQVAGILADDEKKFKAVASGVAGIAGAMSAAVGVASLFGAEQEELARIQTRLQSVMAITIGLQQVAEALNKDSYFSVVLLSKAKTMLAAANLRVATSLGISTAAAQAFTIAITGGLIIAVTAVVAGISLLISKQKESAKAAKEFSNKVAQSASEPVAKIESLSQKWSSLGENMKDKKKFVDENKKSFEDLGVEVTNVADAENLLVTNKDAFIESLVAKARAAAGMELAAETYKKALAKMMEAEGMNKTVDVYTPTAGQSLTGGGTIGKSTVSNSARLKVESDAKKLYNTGDKYIKQANEESEKSAAALSKARIKSYNNEASAREKANSKAEKGAKAEYDAQKELMDQLAELRRQNAALEIDQMQDGLKKRLKQIDAERDQELAAVTKKQQEILSKYNESDAGKKNPQTEIKNIPGIDPKTLEAIEAEKLKITGAAEKQRVQAAADANAEIVKLANSYADERTRIALQYDEDITRLEAAGQTAAAAAARAERDRSISDTTAEMITSTELYKTASDDKLQISAETTAKLIEEIKKRIEAEIKAGNLSKEKGKEMLNDLNKTGISSQADKNKNNPFAQLITGVGDYKKALEGVKAAKAGGASAEEVAKLEAAANNALKSTAAAAGAALQGAQQILGSVVDGLDQLGMLSEEEKEMANQAIGMIGGAANLATGIASGNPVQIIQGSIDLIVNAIKLFDKKSRDIEKAQKKHLQNVSDLERTYTRLQRAVDKALGTDVYGAQKALIENNKKQIAEYEAWIAQERKKKKKKQDEEAIKDKLDKIQELKNNTEDQVQAITESLAQTNAKDLAGQLADALVSAFQNGEDAAVAMGNVVNDVLRNAVVNSLKLQFLEKPLDEAVKYLGEAMNDGPPSDAEKKVFGSMVTTAGNNFNNALAAYDEILGATDAARSGASKGIATADQDSIDELNGGVYALRAGVADIRNSSRDQLLVQRTISSQLDRIANNTEHLKDIAKDINDIKVKGVNIKV